MFKIAHILAVALPVLAAVPQAAAHHYEKKHHSAKKVHYGGKPGLGYWRHGPAMGYGFAFSSYRGDPFGSDDYYDGDRCYYDHHRDFCLKTKIFTGFR